VSTISEKIDASALLTEPSDTGDDFVKTLESEAGILLGGIMWFIRKAFGVSPLEELVKPISGDWRALERAKGGWESAGLACHGVSTNFLGLQNDTVEWTGDAAPAFRERMGTVSENFATYGEGCTTLAGLTNALIDVSKAVASTISMIIGWIAEEITMLAACASVPGPGWIVGGAKIATSIRKYWGWIKRGYQAIKRILKAVSSFVKAVGVLMDVLRSLTLLLNTFSMGMGYVATVSADEAAENQFGVHDPPAVPT